MNVTLDVYVYVVVGFETKSLFKFNGTIHPPLSSLVFYLLFGNINIINKKTSISILASPQFLSSLFD